MQTRIPAVCDECGKISFNVIVASNADLTNATGSYLCPYCKSGEAVFRMDIYKIIYNLVDDVKTSTPERLNEIKGILNQYNNSTINNNFNFDLLSNEIVTKAPELKSLKDLIPQTRAEVYAVIGIFFTIVGIVATTLLSGGSVDHKTIIDKAIQKSPTKALVRNLDGNLMKPKTNVKILTRNEKCFCGSGKKFKKCHGK